MFNILNRLTGYLVLALKRSVNMNLSRQHRPATEQEVDDAEIVLIDSHGNIFCSIMLFDCDNSRARIGFKTREDVTILRCGNKSISDVESFKKQLTKFHEEMNSKHSKASA